MEQKQQQMSLDGKLAVVCGADVGLGAAVALELCKRGALVLAVGQRMSGLKELKRMAKTDRMQVCASC